MLTGAKNTFSTLLTFTLTKLIMYLYIAVASNQIDAYSIKSLLCDRLENLKKNRVKIGFFPVFTLVYYKTKYSNWSWCYKLTVFRIERYSKEMSPKLNFFLSHKPICNCKTFFFKGHVNGSYTLPSTNNVDRTTLWKRSIENKMKYVLYII